MTRTSLPSTLAGTIVLASLLALTACSASLDTAENIAPTVAPAPVAEQSFTPAVDKRTQRVTIAAVGDIMLGTDYPKNILPDDDGLSFLDGVSADLQSADVAFGNLEGVLMDGGEPEKTCSNPNACYLFRTPTRYAQHLAVAGFDAVSLANNHAVDFGEAGRDSSMLALESVGIKHSGREGDIALWTNNNIRYALIAFSPTRGSHDLLSFERYAPQITALSAGNDIVIVSFHGGAEGQAGVERLGFGMEYAYGEKRGDVIAFAHAMIDAGADVVIGHGPHIPRAIEIYRGRAIAYSLGNFATYYGISVADAKGYAPVLRLELDGTGQFLNGRINSYVQLRPGGPVPDTSQRAWRMIERLTRLDFPNATIRLNADGSFSETTTEELAP